MPIHHILRVEIDETDIQTLAAAGLRIAVTRAIEPARPEQLVWLSFVPRTVTTVTWTEGDVRLYFNAQWPLVPGATVLANGTSDTLTPGGVYEFSFTGGFNQVSDDGPADRYTLVDREPTGVMAFGLAEVGTLYWDREETKLRPLNLTPLAPNSRIPFLVTKRVQVFTSTAEPSVILSDEPRGEAIELDFGERRVWVIRYDGATGRFVALPPDDAAT